MQENNISSHSLTLESRKTLSLTGVSDVMGFDETTVNAETASGTIVVKGSGMHISRLSLDTGEVTVDGNIDSLQYLNTHKDKGIMSRLFR